MGDKFHYEFFGPWGPGALIVAMPMVVLGLVYGCNAHGCMQVWPRFSVPGFPPEQPLYSHEAMAVVGGWFALVLLLHLMVPGQYVHGVVLPNGRRLAYKLNAFPILLILYSSAVVLSFGLNILDLSWVLDNVLPLTTAAILFSTMLSLYVHAASFVPGRLLSSHGTSGVAVYDLWMGRELNPRVWMAGLHVDLKEFCELQPGMIGWALLNLSYAYAQQQRLGHLTNAMLLVNAFELWYVADSLYNERSILSTMDITTEGFGFMLSFGDLAWVPFVFSTQARYLAVYPRDLTAAQVGLVLAVQALGYWMFRGANGQKDAFRRNPNDPAVAHLRSMPTARGTRLIISGWWGAARHINYLGDWIMGLAWCLPCGLDGAAAVIPYMYAIYFAVLLVHRERRDEAACRLKYGPDWDKYCKLVPWRIIPYVY